MNIKPNKDYIIGICLGVASCLISICVFALLMLLFRIDIAYSPFFATLCISLGAFISSFFIARKKQSKGYLIGIITGLGYFAVITVMALIITKGKIGSNTAFHFVIILLASTVGGILGVGNKKSKIL
ncbi:MAG: TIGR04086 family membrane protein [Clostridia bacterium]|nr:TIGR04086 family membrane protein [Clostridia bacterium]